MRVVVGGEIEPLFAFERSEIPGHGPKRVLTQAWHLFIEIYEILAVLTQIATRLVRRPEIEVSSCADGTLVRVSPSSWHDRMACNKSSLFHGKISYLIAKLPAAKTVAKRPDARLSDFNSSGATLALSTCR